VAGVYLIGKFIPLEAARVPVKGLWTGDVG
jgi:hypothetical protein